MEKDANSAIAPPESAGRARSAVLHRALNKTYPVAVRGEGVWLFDADGAKFLDFASSAVVNFIGHGDPAIVRAMAEQASTARVRAFQ